MYFKSNYRNIVDFRRLNFLIMRNRVKFHPLVDLATLAEDKNRKEKFIHYLLTKCNQLPCYDAETTHKHILICGASKQLILSEKGSLIG